VETDEPTAAADGDDDDGPSTKTGEAVTESDAEKVSSSCCCCLVMYRIYGCIWFRPDIQPLVTVRFPFWFLTVEKTDNETR